MFIQTEETPNPQAMKFYPGRSVMDQGTLYLDNLADAVKSSPLAKRLFSVDGVESVFLGSDFVTVGKVADKDWMLLKPEVLGAIMEHFLSGLPVLNGVDDPSKVSYDDPLVAQIVELLDTRVRPAVAQDGGDITFDRFEDGVVYLKMQGACSGCPSSSATLKNGIENMLKHYVPEVVEVRAV